MIVRRKMKLPLFFLSIFIVVTLSQCTQCKQGFRDVCDGIYITDTIELNLRLLNAALEYKQYDTIWINSDVSDDFTPLSGNPVTFTAKVEDLYLTIQPYQLNNSSSLPYLQYANIEFNPIVKDGRLENLNQGGYIYKFRRNAPYNKLSAGLVAGRPGTYIIECIHSSYPYSGGGNFQINNGTNTCISYLGKSTFNPAQQNLEFWNSLTTTNLSLLPDYGTHTIFKDYHNYFIIRVVP